MNPVPQIVNVTTGQIEPAVLLMTDGAGKMTVEDTETVIEEIMVRATYVGSVLESILHEPHGEPRWGLNE